MACDELAIGQHVYWQDKQVLGRITRIVTSAGCGPGNQALTSTGVTYPVRSYHIENLITGAEQFYSFKVPWQPISKSEADDIRNEMASTLLTSPQANPDATRDLLNAYAQARAEYQSGAGTWAAVERAANVLKAGKMVKTADTKIAAQRGRIAARIRTMRRQDRMSRAQRARANERRQYLGTSASDDAATPGMLERHTRPRTTVVLTRTNSPVGSDKPDTAA